MNHTLFPKAYDHVTHGSENNPTKGKNKLQVIVVYGAKTPSLSINTKRC